MKKEPPFREWMRSAKILRPPRHSLATFGTTTLDYVLLSPLSDPAGACRRREGRVTAERPQILTPDVWRKRFEGFGENTQDWQSHLDQLYGDAFRALEYTFRNDLNSTSTEHAPLAEVAERAGKMLDAQNATRTALLEGPDQAWSLVVMKFIVETSLRSFPSNIKELDERGLFDPEKRQDQRQRMEIEKLFQLAQKDPSQAKRLGEYLKATGLFTDYEDRFFALIRR